MVSALLAMMLFVQDPETEQLKKRVTDLEKRLQQVESPKGEMPQAPQGADLPKMAQDPKRDAGEVYSKPFLARFGRNVYLGGYMDLEFFNTEDSNGDTFDQHRFVPFIYADISKNIKMAAEIEIEHGSELGIEFAHVDYWMHDLINFRAGILLDPLGHFNLVHDAPYQDLTLRPLVDEFVIPVVLREPGVGFFGTLDADPWEFDYEIYVVNGFKGLSESGATAINRTSGTRNARPHDDAFGTPGYRDFNDNKAIVGRVSASPFLGLEVGASAHSGKYDEGSDNRLTIWALDWTANLGGIVRALGADGSFLTRFEVVGEYAQALIERDAFAEASGIPDDFDGFYLEGRFHFMPDFLMCIPGANEESTFTLVYRFDSIDLDGNERTAHTFGLNFRPQEDTVFKFEYQRRDEDGDLTEIDNDAFVASLASYF